jgi:hypothetical protein
VEIGPASPVVVRRRSLGGELRAVTAREHLVRCHLVTEDSGAPRVADCFNC